MASLLTDPLYETSGQAPPPNKNFHYFTVTKSNVIWRWWKISLRAVDRFSKPGELKESHQDFLDDTELQSEIGVIFGHQILEYTKALCQGRYDYLSRLSDSLLLQIINCLELEDVGHLGQTSHRFRKLCGSEEFWEQAVRRRCKTISDEVASLAPELGWRTIFFTSKLQLQKMISRRRQIFIDRRDGQDSDTDAKEEESSSESSELHQASASEEDIHPGHSPYLSLGSDSDTEFNTTAHCDVDISLIVPGRRLSIRSSGGRGEEPE